MSRHDLTDDRLRNMSAWLPHHIEQEMASELLALRAENARLAVRVDTLEQDHTDKLMELSDLVAENARLRSERDGALEGQKGIWVAVRELEAQCTTLRAENARLREALMPFASDHPITIFDFVAYREDAIAAIKSCEIRAASSEMP